MANNVMEWNDCAGMITHGQHRWDVRCSIRYTTTGSILFQLDDIPINEQAFELYRLALSDEGPLLPFVHFHGTSADGTLLSSNALYFTQAGERTDSRSSVIRVAGEAANLDVIRPGVEFVPGSDAVVRYHTVGMRGFGSFIRDVPAGTLEISAPADIENAEVLAGTILLQAEAVQSFVGWLAQCDDVVAHILRVVSFAQGRMITWTIRQAWAGNRLHSMRFVNARGAGHRAEPTLHHLNMDPVIDLGLAYHGLPTDARERLGVAIEWLLVPSTYAEVRFWAAVTGFEHLLSSEPDSSGRFLESAVFRDVIREPLHRALFDPAIRARLADLNQGARSWSADVMLEGMAAKLGDLNRPPFRDRLREFISRYDVPIADITVPLEKLLQTRNRLVHGAPTDTNDPSASLTLRAVMMREVLRRTILALLGFEGQFYSYVRGPEWLTFRSPPTMES